MGFMLRQFLWWRKLTSFHWMISKPWKRSHSQFSAHSEGDVWSWVPNLRQVLVGNTILGLFHWVPTLNMCQCKAAFIHICSACRAGLNCLAWSLLLDMRLILIMRWWLEVDCRPLKTADSRWYPPACIGGTQRLTEENLHPEEERGRRKTGRERTVEEWRESNEAEWSG